MNKQTDGRVAQNCVSIHSCSKPQCAGLPDDFKKSLFLPTHSQVSALAAETAELPQGLQEICPSRSLKVLLGQGKQSSGCVARNSLPNLPVGHGVGLEVPSGQ